MDDDDVFDSISWENPAAPAYDDHHEHTPLGPGFRQSTSEGNDDPLQPKWEGYLITAVRDPVKELAETKDAYVSYLVTAKVLESHLYCSYCGSITTDKPAHILHSLS